MFLLIYSFHGLMWSIPFLFEKFDGLHRLFEYQHLAFFASGRQSLSIIDDAIQRGPDQTVQSGLMGG